MRCQILLVLFLQVALVESLEEVSGYLGHSVTLRSGGNSSWDLTSIEWSIFANNTWIATYRNGKKIIERTIQYTGRLSLNITSGDLTIHNLTRDDAMEYTVDLNTEKNTMANKIKLTVRRPLRKPTIKTLFNAPTEGGCWMGLHCTSGDEGVDFTWNVNASVTAFNMSDPDGNLVGLSAFLNSTQNYVQFTCKNMESASSVVIQKCDVADGKRQPQSPCRDRCGLCVGIGVVVGVALIVIICIFRGKIKTAWENLKGKMCPSKNSSQSEA